MRAIIGLLFCLICVPVYADTVTVAWDYPDPPADLAGFDLRINADDSTMIAISPDILEWTGEIAFLDGENVLDMRAKDELGRKSIWSEPCYYNPIPDTPRNLTIRVVVTVDINEEGENR